MRLVQTTDPSEYPVTVAEARRQCALYDETSHDALLLGFIASATDEVEAYLKSALMTRTYTLYLDGFPSGDLDLKIYPVTAISSIKYDDTADTEQTLASTKYWSSLHGMQPFVRVIDTWPTTYTDKPNSVRVVMTAGYSTVYDVPQDVKQSILFRVYEMFENRGVDAPMNKQLAGPHRRYNV